MRLFLPERFPLQYVAIFAALLFLFQQLEGTSLAFSIYSATFIVIAALATNAGGGLTKPSGAYVFFYAVLGVIVGLTWKAILGERADSHLLRPELTMLVFIAGAFGLLGATLLSRRFAHRPAYLSALVDDTTLQSAAIGCLVMNILIILADRFLFAYISGVLTALNQINRFDDLAIILGVTYTIRKSGGRRSLNLTVLIAGLIQFVNNGLLGFSKEGLFTPFACWIVAAAAQGYRVSRAQMLTLVATLFFLFHYMVPYSQYGRNFLTYDFQQNVKTSLNLLSDLTATREKATRNTQWDIEDAATTFYDRSQGFFDRLQMISTDDSLIDLTELKGTYGLYPVLEDVENLVPHFIWPNKPSVLWGNVYLHEMGGILAEDDTTTGISFTPTGEAFHLARWVGVLVIAPVVWIILFLLFDSLCGDARRSPWALIQIVLFAHIAPEGLLSAPIYEFVYGTFAITFAALLSAYVMPHVGKLLIGPGRVMLEPVQVRSVPRRRPLLATPEPGEV